MGPSDMASHNSLQMPARDLLAHDRHRPAYHFLAPANWMNDPNGLIQLNGTLHLFYQYNPLGPWHERIHWGHAVSDDLVHWHDLPIALVPQGAEHDADGCWSGCAVDDGGVPTLIYTGVFPQVVNLATSRDGLLTWQKLPSNPIISGPPSDLAPKAGGHFRDPFVWREEGEWRMVIGTKQEDSGGLILSYRSPDLVQWEYVGPLLAGDLYSVDPAWGGTMWECPNLLDFGAWRALILSPQATPTDHLEPVFHVGAYAEGRLESTARGVLVYGRSFYAPQVTRLGDGRYVAWGWLKEARSDAACLAAGWNGVMSLPLVVAMDEDGALALEPVIELRVLRRQYWRFDALTQVQGEDTTLLPEVAGLQLEIMADLELEAGGEAGIALCCSSDLEEQTLILCRSAHEGTGGEIVVERSRSSCNPDTLRWPVRAPLRNAERVRLRIFLDHSVIEIYADAGRTALVTRIYPKRADSIHVGTTQGSENANVRSVEIWALDSAWQ